MLYYFFLASRVNQGDPYKKLSARARRKLEGNFKLDIEFYRFLRARLRAQLRSQDPVKQ